MLNVWLRWSWVLGQRLSLLIVFKLPVVDCVLACVTFGHDLAVILVDFLQAV